MVSTPSTISVNNTPQSSDDTFKLLEDSVTLLNDTILELDVLANDTGGAARKLWSIDDTNILQNLLTSDQAGLWEATGAGNRMRIVADKDGSNGKIQIDLANSLANYGGSLQGLGATESITETVYYTTRLANGTLSVAKAYVTVLGQNDGPVITSAAVTKSFTEDSPAYAVVGRFMAKDADVHDSLTFSGSAESKLGTFTVQTDGRWSFVLNNASSAVQGLGAGDVTTLTYPVTVSDGKGGSATQTVTIKITGTNDTPVISDASTAKGWVNEDLATQDGATVARGQIVVTDADSNATLTFSKTEKTTGSADYGTFAVDRNGNWTFTLDNTKDAVQTLAAGEKVKLTFTVTATDDKGAAVSRDVTVQITGTNDAPVIASDPQSGSLTEDRAQIATGTITASDVDHNATLTFTGDKDGQYGSFVIDSASGKWTYTLNNDAHQNLASGDIETDTFTVTVTDDTGATATQKVTITVTGTNDTPVITSGMQNGSVTEDGQVTASGTVSASDIDHNAILTFSGNASGTYGSFAVDAVTGKWVYTLDNDTHQSLTKGEQQVENFTVTATDDTGATASQAVSITVTGTNDVPTVTSATNSVKEDATVTGTVSGADADAGETAGLVYSVFGVAPTGLTFNADGSYSFDASSYDTLKAGAMQDIVVEFTATDAHSATSEAKTLTITITGTNDVPTVTAATNAVNEDAIVTGTVSGSDADAGETAGLVYSVFGVAPTGMTFNSDGSYSFDASSYDTLTKGETKVIVLNFTATDAHSATSEAKTLTITLTGTNDIPTVSANFNAVMEDAIVSGTVSGSDIDAGETGTLTYAVAGMAPTGLTLNADGKYTFDASSYDSVAAGKTKEIVVDFTATDAQGSTSEAKSLTITVIGTNDAPVLLAPVGGSVAEDGTTSGRIEATDIDGDTLTYGIAAGSPKPNGLTLFSTGNWTFDAGSYDTLAAGETKTVKVNVVAMDSNSSLSNTQELAITITGINDTATIGGTGGGTVTEDGTLTASNTLSISDVDNGEAKFKIPASLAGTYGTFTFTDAGAWTYTLNNANADVQALNTGSSLQDKLTVASLDGTATQNILVRINGADEPVTKVSNGFADTITGTASADTLSGDLGDDVIYGGGGGDSISGGNNNDYLYGGDGNDTIYGGNQADKLDGGAGNDQLYGGNQADSFIFQTSNNGNDTIYDFTDGGTSNPNSDRIDLSLVDGNTNTSADDGLVWGGTTATKNGVWYGLNFLESGPINRLERRHAA